MQCTTPLLAGNAHWLSRVPKAEVHLSEGGHFLLEEHAQAMATLIRKFLGAKRDAQRR
jgi:surfactin synthase thioesterase subunit